MQRRNRESVCDFTAPRVGESVTYLLTLVLPTEKLWISEQVIAKPMEIVIPMITTHTMMKMFAKISAITVHQILKKKCRDDTYCVHN